MSHKGTAVVNGETYYHERLWEALVAQNLEMGQQQNMERERMNDLHADLAAARVRVMDLQNELDFALQQLDDATRKVIKFQREQVK